MTIVRELVHHDEDVTDPQIPLLLWWAIEDKLTIDLNDGVRLLSNADDWRSPMMRQHLLERIARRFASMTTSIGKHACVWMVRTAPGAEERAGVLRGFDKAWEGPGVQNRLELKLELATRWSTNDPLLLRVSLRVGLPQAQQLALQQLTNIATPEAERLALAEVLGQCAVTSAQPALVALLDDKPKLQLAAVNALQNFSHSALATTLLPRYPKLSPEARARVRIVLASRAIWAGELLRATERGPVDAKDISPDLLQQMLRHNDPTLTAAIEKRWGKLQPQTSAETASTVNRLKLVLNPSGTTLRFKGEAAAGKKLFTALCATCHKLFGEGNTIGPELTGADRKNVDWLLTQIVDPSGFIRPEYVNHNVEMKDGRSLTGLIVEQGEGAVTLLDAQNQRTVLNRAGVKDINASATSLMPEGLLEALTPQQVRDLFAHLQQ